MFVGYGCFTEKTILPVDIPEVFSQQTQTVYREMDIPVLHYAVVGWHSVVLADSRKFHFCYLLCAWRAHA